MSSGTLTIDPSRMSEDEWISAIQTYIRAAKDAGEVVNLRARPEFLTPQEAGERLGMSRTTVVRAINAGELSATKVGNRHRIAVAAVDDYRKQCLHTVLAEFHATMDDLGIDSDTPVPDDPVVAYDIMREAANRLVAAYARQITVGGLDDPAIARIRAVRAEVAAVGWNDIAAQKAKTEELRRRYGLVRR